MELPLFRVKIEEHETKTTQWPSTGPTEAAQSYLDCFLDKNKALVQADQVFTVIVEIDEKVIKFFAKVAVLPTAKVHLIP